MRRLAVVVLVAAVPAQAEAPWLVARGRVEPEVHAELFGGTRSVGAGLMLPDGDRAAYAVELMVSYVDRVSELRGSRVWLLTPLQVGTASAAVSVVGTVVPEGGFDLGLGPFGTLSLSLGVRPFTVDLSVSTGLELFVRQDAPRFVERLGLGLASRVGPVSLALMARAGVDLQPGHFVAFRGEAVVAVGWLFAPLKGP